MEGQEFGPLVKRAAKAKGLSQGRLGYLLTDDDGPFIDSSRVRLLYEGKWRLTHATVERLINILAPHLDPAEAWASSGLLPPGVTATQLRKLDLVATHSSRVSPDKLATVLALPSDLDAELIRRLRPDRRHRDRRHPRPAPVLPGTTPGQRRPRWLEVAA